MKKLKTEYQVWLNFVDDTYWDDESRWTNRKEVFETKKQALEFIDKVKKEGYSYKGYGGQGFIDSDFIRDGHIQLIKVAETLLDLKEDNLVDDATKAWAPRLATDLIAEPEIGNNQIDNNIENDIKKALEEGKKQVELAKNALRSSGPIKNIFYK